MDEQTAVNKFKKMLESNEKYTLTGQLNILSNEENYQYDVEVKYLKGDYYRASLNNKESNHEQIILKNTDGVYIITPNLNKSYKFQSEWPYNSSQSYILESILFDLENDSEVKFEENDDEYILYSTVNYPSNVSLVSQKVTFDKNMCPKLIEVYDKNGTAAITFKISKIDFSGNISKNDFEVLNNKSDEVSENVSSLDEVVYPMYLPTGSVFKGEETVSSDESERVILTFSGEKPFTLIEEVSKIPSEFEITASDGELVFYENVVGSLNDTTLNWTMNGKDYYIISDNLTKEELLNVASSTSVVALTK